MALPAFSMRQLIEAGCHFGHNTRRWNPRMKPYLFGVRDGVHIIDLQQSVPLLQRAMQAVHDVTAAGGRVLFVGTKRQAQDLVKEYAERCGQYYVNHRWLGGTLTNWKTVSHSIKRLKELEERLKNNELLQGLTKKEQLTLQREQEKLDRSLGGIKDMGGLPDILFVIDTNKEAIAVAEAKVLNIPVVAVVDSNSDPSGITYPVPGNDDAIRAVKLYCELVANTVLEGIQDEMKSAGVDVGEAEAAAEALPGAEGVEDDGDHGDKPRVTVVKKPSRSRTRGPKKADAPVAVEAAVEAGE
ncbi:MAG: 30S ribosomal protein S2 [Rhodospirillaceae bacterium]|nr:MAG: 30S ribosomal protein S2 [Rhodospirillaceae bacterium]